MSKQKNIVRTSSTPGRKPLSEAGSQPVFIRLSKETHAAVLAKSAGLGIPASAWMRMVILKALEKW